jgi:hypothetical protein
MSDEQAPTFFVDGIFGTAKLGSVHRITFVQFLFDPAEGAELPRSRTTVHLAIPTEALPIMIKELESLLETPANGP